MGWKAHADLSLRGYYVLFIYCLQLFVEIALNTHTLGANNNMSVPKASELCKFIHVL